MRIAAALTVGANAIYKVRTLSQGFNGRAT